MDITEPASSPVAFLAGAGEMAERIRSFDWASTSLGPPSGWGASLKAMVRMLLTTQHPVYIFWGAEHIGLYNDAYRASLGPEKHPHALGRPGKEVWAEIWPIIGPQMALVLRGEGATWHENQLVPIIRHGALADVYWTYSYGPIDDAHAANGVGGVLVLVTETTEQVMASRRLEAERANFAALFEQAPTFMVLLQGPQHVVELANPGYMKLINHRPVLGKPVAEALPEAVTQGFIRLLDEVYTSGIPFSATGVKFTLHPASDAPGAPDDERYLDFVYQPIKDSTGRVSGIFVEGVDVTERRRTEAALRVSEDRFRMAVESAHLGTFDVDLASGAATLSPGAQDMFALHGEGLTLQQLYARMPDEDRRAVQAAIAAALAGEGDGLYRLRHRVASPGTGSGRVRWLNMSGRLIAGTPAQLVGVLWDVTEQQALLDTLQDADRRKDEFIATLAHELRNPLQAISTAALLLARPELSTDRLLACSAIVQRQSETMSVLLDDLLEVSRITSGKLDLKFASVSLRSVVDAAVESVHNVFEKKQHRLDVHLPDGDVLLECDPVRVAQILANLLTNAAKYSEPSRRVQLSAVVQGADAVFTVQDEGIGLAADSIPLLFRMFHQIHGSQDKADGGLGIGLGLTKGLVELHHGQVLVRSAGLGAGAEFEVRLPLLARQPLPAADASARSDAVASPMVQQGLRLLIADDNEDAARGLAEFLALDGFDVRVVFDGPGALALAQQLQPAAALLDIGLPGMDGLELARRLRASPGLEGMLLVATTGLGQQDDKRRAKEAGFDFHLTKPTDPKTVSRLLQQQLRPGG